MHMARDWRPRLSGLILFFFSTSTALAATPPKVRIGYLPVLGSAQLFIIDGEGWAKRDGLNLKLIKFQTGTVMIQALASGQLDAYIAGVAPLLLARSHGIDITIVAALATEELSIIGRGALVRELAKNSDLKTAIAAFSAANRRKPKIAAQPYGSVPDLFLRYWLTQVEHIDLHTVDIVGVGIEASQQAFVGGAVDAAIVRQPALTLIEDRDQTAKVIATGAQIFKNQPGSVLGIYQLDRPGHRKLAETLVGLIKRATVFIKSDPKKAAIPIHRELGAGIIPLDVIDRALTASASRFESDPSLILDSTATMQDYQVKLGLLKAPVPLDKAFDLSIFRDAR